MGSAKKLIKKIIPKEILPSPPAMVEPEPEPAPVPEPVAMPEPTPEPAPVATPDPVVTNPVVSDPVPVEETPTETQETAQAVQRKKKGRKPLIATSSQGLGGTPTTYSPTLLG